MQVPVTLTAPFVLITLAVAVAIIAALGRAFARESGPAQGKRAAAIAAAVAAAWMTAHALVAESGVLEGGPPIPPRVAPYLGVTMVICVLFTRSRAGELLARHTPLAALVAFQGFRLPLEIWLHAMYDAGHVPVQMTWSGLNFDVVTGVSALAVGALAWRGAAPRALVWAWNVLGSVLLVVVVAIAFMSAPTALRVFTDGPSLDLVLHAPFNWIATVLVASALVGHLIVFRRLMMEDA
jgi:hypothetical protein